MDAQIKSFFKQLQRLMNFGPAQVAYSFSWTGGLWNWQAGKPNARLNSAEAHNRADVLQSRLERRLEELTGSQSNVFTG